MRRELIRVPAGTGIKLTIQTHEVSEFRVILVDNALKKAIFDEVLLITNTKSITSKPFPVDTSVMLLVNPLSSSVQFTYKVTMLRKRRPMPAPSMRMRPGIRGGNPSNQTSSDDGGGFLVQAEHPTAYVLQSASGGKIILNG